ncbi:MAG: hypothetical protein IPI67_17015 [Myxococcales bacterium]|nr:hypothetical protein [Myxococcales bacterium]
MNHLVKVPDRYKPLLERIFTDYAEAVRAIEAETHGSVCLELEVERGEKLCWHYATQGDSSIREGAPGEKDPVLLHISVHAERLYAAMASDKSIRDVAFASGVQVRGDIDFAFRVLARAEQVRAHLTRKEC